MHFVSLINVVRFCWRFMCDLADIKSITVDNVASICILKVSFGKNKSLWFKSEKFR